MPAALDIAHALALAAAIALGAPVLVLALEIACARRAGDVGAAYDREPIADSERPSLAVVMPAHDEAEGIGAAIASVRAQLAPGDRLIVVADNCRDATARIAAAAGAEVVERCDETRRGKGYALDFGVRHLIAAPPAVVAIVDADCLLAPGTLGRIATLSRDRECPVQALYLMRSPPPSTLRSRIAEFAWIVKNEVRPRGLLSLGLPCHLMGTGMAFPWPLIRTAPLATGHIVEDLRLGLDLAVAGHAPLFCPEALVTSVFPASGAAREAQRTRWEHGHLGVIASAAPRLLARAVMQGDGALAALVLDLCVPPIAALALMLFVVLLASTGVVLAGGAGLAATIAAVEMLLLVTSVGIAWRRFARHLLGWTEIAAAPFFLLAKLPFYVRMLRKRRIEWVRTRRDDGRH